ncbi:MAG: hypothetical protein ABI960_00665 [Candidatus Eisenbacteria bacterium]
MTPIRRFAAGARRLELYSVGRTIGLSSLVGAVAGLGAILFQYLCQYGSHFFLDRLAGLRMDGPAGETLLLPGTQTAFHPWMLPIVAGFGGLLSGIIVQRFAPEAAGHGTDEAVDAFHRRGGVIRSRVPFVKTVPPHSRSGPAAPAAARARSRRSAPASDRSSRPSSG